MTANTHDEAIAEIHRQARAMATGGTGGLSPSGTITDAVALWLSQVLTGTPILIVSGTIVSTKAQGMHRKNSLKRSRGRRSIALPSMAAAAGVVAWRCPSLIRWRTCSPQKLAGR